MKEISNWPEKPWQQQRLTKLHEISAIFGRNPFGRVISRGIELLIRVVFSAYIPASAKISPSVHFGHNGLGVIINGRSEIGEYVYIGPLVVLGGRTRIEGAPTILDHAIIHAGAKIIGPITVGRGAVIGTNAVVNKDVPDRAVVVGVPARIVKQDIDPTEYLPI